MQRADYLCCYGIYGTRLLLNRNGADEELEFNLILRQQDWPPFNFWRVVLFTNEDETKRDKSIIIEERHRNDRS